MSGRLPVISGQDAIKAFQRAGFQAVPARGKGSHTFMTRDDPKINLVIPHQRELKRGLLRGLIRTANMSVAEFVDLLD